MLQPATGAARSGKEMVGFAFKKIFTLMPKVLGLGLPQGMQQREDVKKLVALAWIDGRWHNRLSTFTVGIW